MRNVHRNVSVIGKMVFITTFVLTLFLVPPFGTTQAMAQDYTALVIGVDYPEGCLRIRAAPSTSADIIGCAEMGSTMRLTGAWNGEWAEISRPIYGWVYGPQIDAGVAPSTVVVTTPQVEYYTYPVYSPPILYSRYWRHGTLWPWRKYSRHHKKFKYWRKGHRSGFRYGHGHSGSRRSIINSNRGSIVRASRGGSARSSFRISSGRGGRAASFRGGGSRRGGAAFRGRGGGRRGRR